MSEAFPRDGRLLCSSLGLPGSPASGACVHQQFQRTRLAQTTNERSRSSTRMDLAGMHLVSQDLDRLAILVPRIWRGPCIGKVEGEMPLKRAFRLGLAGHVNHCRIDNVNQGDPRHCICIVAWIVDCGLWGPNCPIGEGREKKRRKKSTRQRPAHFIRPPTPIAQDGKDGINSSPAKLHVATQCNSAGTIVGFPGLMSRVQRLGVSTFKARTSNDRLDASTLHTRASQSTTNNGDAWHANYRIRRVLRAFNCRIQVFGFGLLDASLPASTNPLPLIFLGSAPIWMRLLERDCRERI